MSYDKPKVIIDLDEYNYLKGYEKIAATTDALTFTPEMLITFVKNIRGADNRDKFNAQLSLSDNDIARQVLNHLMIHNPAFKDIIKLK